MNGSIILGNGSKFEVSNVTFGETMIEGKPMKTVTFDAIGGDQMLIFQETNPVLYHGIRKYRLASQNGDSQDETSIFRKSNMTMYVNSDNVSIESLESQIVDMLGEAQEYSISESDEKWRDMLDLSPEEHPAFERVIHRLRDKGIISIPYREAGGILTKLILK